MTTQEFKEKYPHLAHLEGDELWNAMEDSYLIEHKNDKQEKAVDWKGNEIKEGDEICFIKILDKQVFRFMGFMLGGEMIGEPEPEREPIPCWEVGEYQKVEIKNGQLCVSAKLGDFTFTEPLSFKLHLIDKECCVLAIKGISDKQS